MLTESPSCLDVLRSLYYECGQGTSSPDPDSLIACLHKVLGSFHDIFVVIDALDECTTTDELMKFLDFAIRWELPSLHLLVTSRKTAEIDEALGTVVRASTALTPEDIDPDIQRYISRVLRDQKDFKRWDLKSLAEIEDVLIQRASGMYVPHSSYWNRLCLHHNLAFSGFAGSVAN
jgi:ankyrin repeat domain-containing protein 50